MINQHYLSWYINSSEWTKQNFLMSLLKLCTIHLIRSLQLFISELEDFTEDSDFIKDEDIGMNFTRLKIKLFEKHIN